MTLQEQASPDTEISNQPGNNNPSSSASSSSSSEPLYTPPSPSSMSTTSASNTTMPAPPHGTANISVREYIYFLPYPLPPHTPVPYSIHLPAKNPLNLPPHQFEPTSTLVLTSPLNTFVDIRLFKPTQPGHSALPTKSERERLEWAFAGTSVSAPIPDPHGGEEPWKDVTKSTWTHWLDSRYAVGARDIPVDEGVMYPINDTLTLEHGHAYHPALKAVKTHEEMWRNVPVAAVENDKKVCIVLRLQDDNARARGVVVRLGQYVQGLVMVGEYSTVERWEYEGEGRDGGDGEEQGARDGGWERTARVGDLFLPCGVTWREDVLSVGGRIRYKDYEWVVEEAWEW
ncbi:hypothetical protein FB567DRAFT_523635 [Paraphoma chrysanthemicola]|uniref:Protein HRI1 n=1 Tax=Paraphoma chrysanthemicola TaxID=798071 RepID=A0A8K0VYW8_9PLEO|nr:hypothetical protein FB567DRAFT_523635 [Paraphoma chrysanthemicola]